MKLRRMLIFLIAIAAVIGILLVCNELFFKSSPPPFAPEDWNVSTTPPALDTTPSPTPTPTTTPAPTSNWEFIVPTSGSWMTSAITTSTPTPVATDTPTPSPRPTAVPTAKPTATSSSSALRLGDEGTRVRSVQQKLKDLGYLTGSADGIFGAATESAVKAFQAANGLRADGVVGANTLSKLNSASAKPKSTESLAKATPKPTPKEYTPSELKNYRFLQLGSSGRDVTRLQNRLIELGYLYEGGATGQFDAATEAAVLAFQQRNGQWVDGIAGEDTQTELFSSRALPAAK